MIARHWRGLARQDRAEADIAHLRAKTFPALARLDGFLSAVVPDYVQQMMVDFDRESRHGEVLV
jgi:replicative DNA helicase